jgi:hypothetical protein
VRFHAGDFFQSRDMKALARTANEFLRNQRENNIVISSEAFSFLRNPLERELFDTVFDGFDLKVIVYLRMGPGWLKSWKHQTRGIDSGEQRSSLEITDYDEKSWLMRDDQILKFFGDSVQAVSYDTVLRQDGSVITSFVNSVGLGSIAFTDVHYFENKSVGGETNWAADRPYLTH